MDNRISQGIWVFAVTLTVIFLLWYTDELASRINNTLIEIHQFQKAQIDINQSIIDNL